MGGRVLRGRYTDEMALNTAGGGSGRALYPPGPSLTLRDFSNKDFIVRNFIDDLSASAIPIARRSGPTQQAFDAKPLIRTFESKSTTLRSWNCR